jgi:tetratricopeptide (TPR) repeat protein
MFLPRKCLVLVPLFLSLVMGSGAALGAVDWKSDWEAALKEAAKRKTIVMADVYTDWCKWCKVLDAQTFQDPRVEKMLAELVTVKVNAEKGGGVDLRKQFNVNGFPTVLFVDPKGEEIDRIAGFLKADPFLARVTEIRKGEGTFGDLKRRSAAAPDDLGLTKALADKYLERGDQNQAMTLYDQVLKADPENKRGYAAAIHLGRARASLAARDQAGALVSLEKVAAFDDPDAMREAYPALRRLYLLRNRQGDIDKLHDRATQLLKDDAAVMNDVAWFYASRSERLDEALSWAQQGAKLAPEDTSILDTLAEVHFRRGEQAAAVETIERALALEPSSDYLQKQLLRFKGGLESSAAGSGS